MALRIKYAIAARAIAATVLLAATLVAWTQSQSPAQAEAAPRHPSPASVVRVVDGETIQDLRTAAIYRLANVDAVGDGAHATCPAQQRVADRAEATTGSLIARARTLELMPTGQLDGDGRPTAYVSADGRDLGEILIARGFARPARDSGEPWCDANGGLIL